MYCSSLGTPQVVQRLKMTLIWGWLNEGCDGCDQVGVPQSLLDFLKNTTDCSLDAPPPFLENEVWWPRPERGNTIEQWGLRERADEYAIYSVAHPDGTIDLDTYSIVHPPGSVW